MTIQEIRQRCQRSYYPDFHERMSRTFSPYLTYIFINLGFSANGVTYLSMVFGLVGALVLLLNNSVWWFVSPILLALASLMDHCDGEVARWRGQSSLTGLFVDRLYPIIVHPVTFGIISARLFIDDPSVWYFVIGLILMWLANMPRILNAYVFLCFSDGLLKPKKAGVKDDSLPKLGKQPERVYRSDGSSEFLSRLAYPLVFLLAKGTGIALSVLILVILERASVTILGVRPFAVYVTGYTFAFFVVSVKYAVSFIHNQRPDMVYGEFQDRETGKV